MSDFWSKNRILGQILIKKSLNFDQKIGRINFFFC